MLEGNVRIVTVLSTTALTACAAAGDHGDTGRLSDTVAVSIRLLHPSGSRWSATEGCVVPRDGADGDPGAWASLPEARCGETDATGLLALDVPADAEVLFRLAGDPFPPTLVPVTTRRSAGTLEVVSGSLDETASFQELVGVRSSAPFDPARGWLTFQALRSTEGPPLGQGGVTVALSPDSGTGVIYANAAGLPSDEAATTSSGRLYAADLDEGVYTLRPVHGAIPCSPRLGWHRADAVELPVRDGHLTRGSVVCP